MVCCRLQPWLAKVAAKLPADKQEEFKAKAQPAIKFLLGKLKELQLYASPALPMLPVRVVPEPLMQRSS